MRPPRRLVGAFGCDGILPEVEQLVKAAEGMEVIDVLEAHKDDDAAVAPGSVNFRGWMSVNLVGPTVGV